MGKYTADDNRSMQLNPNNDRYYSSRGYEEDSWDYDTEDMPIQGEQPMLIELNNIVLNYARITHLQTAIQDVELETSQGTDDWGDERWRTTVHAQIDIIVNTDYGLTHTIEIKTSTLKNYTANTSYFLPHRTHNKGVEIYIPAVHITDEEENIPTEEEVIEVMREGINTWVRQYFKDIIDEQRRALN